MIQMCQKKYEITKKNYTFHLSIVNPHTKRKISNLISTKPLLNSFSWFYTSFIFKDYRGQLFSSQWITHTTRLLNHFFYWYDLRDGFYI